jgi:hypothetical protein
METQTVEVYVLSVAGIMVLRHVFTVSFGVKQPASSLNGDLAIPRPQTRLFMPFTGRYSGCC